jgi:eukaryotic-like serine/threonine-protein kinase
MKLGALSDLAAVLGVSRQRALQIRQREDFPAPLGETSQGWIWDLDEVSKWIDTGPRSAGRPSAMTVAKTFGQRFVVDDEPIAIGNFSDVWRGVDRRTRLPVAVKVHRRFSEYDPAIIGKYRLVLQQFMSLSHPNLVPLLAFGETSDGDTWLAMPLATGDLESMRDSVAKSESDTANVMRQVCAGLAYAHQQGVIHRDIRPENILRRDDGVWALSDFGLATRTDLLEIGAGANEDLPHWYTAPEQWDNPRRADQRSDIYSLGKVLQELATGEDPLDRPIVATVFQSVILQATDPNPADRFQSASALATAISRSLTATRELAPYADPQLAAEVFRDRARGPATPPAELFRILEWAERLDESDEEQMRALTRVLPWLSAEAISTLAKQDAGALDRVLLRFGRFVEQSDFIVEYCDEFCDFGQKVVEATSSPSSLGCVVRFIAMMGYRHKRWYARDVLLDILAFLGDSSRIETASRALRELEPTTVRWHLSDFAIRAMPQQLRDQLEAWLGEEGTPTSPLPIIPS